MMKEGRTFLKRSLALVLTAVLLLSNLSGLSMLVDAADESKPESQTIGQIVANNYKLTDEEKAILASGYVVSDKLEYVVPGNNDGLVSVDTDNAKITAKSKDGWTPVSAVIKYGDKKLEVKLTNGVGTYNAATVGNAFSVEVVYQLKTTVSKDVQTQLLNAPAYLQQGVANLDKLSEQNGNLYILEQALPTLNKIATEGYTVSFGSQSVVATMDNEAAKNAILNLQKQYVANAGRLNLSIAGEEYDASNKTGYLINKASKLQAEVQAMAEYAAAISSWLTEVTAMMNYMDEATRKQLKILDGVIDSISAEMGALASADWTAANLGTALVYADADFAKLDALVAALKETTTGLSINEELLVATTTLKANLAMFNVTVSADFYKVNENNELVRYATSENIVLTLPAGATYAEVEAAIEDSGIYAAAEKQWGKDYVKEHYNIEGPMFEVEDGLSQDIYASIVYWPNNYDVTIAGKSDSYPYGYKLTLPKHSDSTKAYDYYDEKGNYVPQGTEIIVDKDMTFTREEGAAYATGNLLSIIADNANNSKLTAILNSGALLIDETINYREPKDLSDLVTLSGSKLTALTYASDYEGLSWVPYSYTVDNKDAVLFNGATEVTISGDFEKVSVSYRLTLTNYTVAEVQEILDLVNGLVNEAQGQKSKLDALASNTGAMQSLDKTKFGALNGVISVADISDEMKAYFTPIVSSIISNCLDTDGKLKLYNMLVQYQDENNGGLAYYYANSENILSELNRLVGYLNDMMGDDDKIAALAVLMNDAGFPEYVDRLATMKEDLNALKRDLVAPNAAIDTSSDNLRKLADALISAGDLSSVKAQSPYLEMGPVVKTADKYVSVEVKVVIGGKTYTVPAVTVMKGNALTDAQITELKAAVAAIIKENLGDNASYYTNDYKNGTDLDALSGKTLTAGESYTYTWTAKSYTVKIDGEADQTITIENLTIKLPGHPNAAAGMSYEYTIDGKTYTAGNFTFTAAQLDSLFVNGTLTITREEKNEAVEKLENMVATINKDMGYEALVLVEKNGVYTGIVANLSVSGIMDFVMGLTNSGYGYIGLDGNGLMYLNEESALEVSVQTLIDAVMNDDSFGSNTLIALGQKGKGVLLNTTLQLGNSAAEIQYNDLSFTINVTSVPEQFVTAANALNSVKSYVKFHTENGVLVFDLNLPDAVYGAYLTALVATGNADKSDINAVNQAIAFQFLYDYFEAVITSDMDAETFTNTIAMLGKDIDLTAYNTYYEYFCSFMNGDSTTVDINETGASLAVSVNGSSVFNGLLKIIGKNPADMKLYLNMIKEYKAGNIDVTVKADLANPDKTYNAMIVDLQASGVTNKYACTSSYSALSNKVSGLAGYSAVMLLDNVSGDLTFSGTTILDLNGKTVTGSIKSTGTLYIIDSSMDTYDCGGATGSISGNVVILGGNYRTDVSSFLKAGYYQDGTAVRNELYHIEEDNGNITFVLNTNIVDGSMPSVRALAMDIAADLALNYATSAALTVGGYDIYDVNLDDLLALLHSSSKTDDVINKVLNSICADENNIMGISGVINMILADLIDFASLEAALANGNALATYDITVAPWHVSLDHITDGNYMTISIDSNPELAKSFTVSLKLDGNHTAYLENLVGELKNIVDGLRTELSVELYKPTYAGKEFDLAAAGSAVVVIDLSGNDDYLTVIGVLLAYGNPDKAEAIAAALNGDDYDAMKEIIDNTTVEDIFTALKKMSRTVDFKTMAAKVGVTDYTESTVALENIYHLLLCGAGKVLEELEIVGTSQKLGALYTENGWYELSYTDIFRDGEYAIRSYNAAYELTAYELTLKVKLFGTHDHEHVFGEWITITEPTCTDAGLEQRYCECGHFESREIPATGHEGEWVIVKEATETETGLMQKICIHCGTVLEEKIIPMLPKTGDYTIVIISSIALMALLALAVVEFGFKRKLLK